MENLELEQEIKKKITALPSKDKVKLVAIKHYLDLLKQTDQAMDDQCEKIQGKYDALSIPIYNQAEQVISGQRVPTVEEMNFADKLLSPEEIAKLQEVPVQALEIKDYWLKVFKNGDLDELTLTEKDEEAFKYLKKVQFHLAENQSDFKLEFHFAENPFFKNEILDKSFVYDKDELVKVESAKVEWKDGKNLTKKLSKKVFQKFNFQKQRNKKTGQYRVITKEVEDDSFFHFFRTVDITNKEKFDKLSDDEVFIKINIQQTNMQQQLDIDQDVGRTIVDELLPYSVEYFLGLKEFGKKDDEEEEEVEDDDEEDEEEVKPKKSKNSKK